MAIFFYNSVYKKYLVSGMSTCFVVNIYTFIRFSDIKVIRVLVTVPIVANFNFMSLRISVSITGTFTLLSFFYKQN